LTPTDETPVDPVRYGELLASVRPGLIESAAEHDRIAATIDELLQKGEDISAEEAKLLGLLVLLVEAYEAVADAEYDEDDEGESGANHRPPLPHETLARLMQARSLEIADIADLFGNPHLTREALEGRRPITRNQAKQLARFFQVPPKLFHS
jgi:HTH-type transcriptional regulator/antitoxin HigA